MADVDAVHGDMGAYGREGMRVGSNRHGMELRSYMTIFL